MESLYNKLHDKYTELKTKKNSEMEQFNHEQEVEFMNYISVAEEHMEHLKDVNKELQKKVDELTKQIVLDRSSMNSQHEYRNLFIEEERKTKVLSEEVEKLRNLISEGHCCRNFVENHVEGDFRSPSQEVNLIDLPKDSADRLQKKSSSRNRSARAFTRNHEDKEPERKTTNDKLSGGALEKFQLPDNCGRDMETLGHLGGSICRTTCIFQTLLECLVGMKFSVDSHTEMLCLKLLHQSSGYSFSLTLVNNSAGQEELLYHVLSLGTFERVAPEWMREDLLFSMSMCAVFFQRLSQITRIHN